MNEEPTEYQQHLIKLRAHGWKDHRIAEMLGCTQSTIQRLRTGKTKEPGHTLGRALERMVTGL